MKPESSVAIERGTAYGRVIREKGTVKIIALAVVLFAAWYGYSTIKTSQMLAQTWPELKRDGSEKMIIVALQDKPRPGWRPRYMAIERSRAWQIRLRDDAPIEADEIAPATKSGAEALDPEERRLRSEVEQRQGNPGTGRSATKGAVIDPSVIAKKCPLILSDKHFSSASIEVRVDDFFNRTYYVVHMGLTDEGRARYWQFSREHEGERLVFIHNNTILTCPRVKHLDVSNFMIEPIWDKADAEKLTALINGGK